MPSLPSRTLPRLALATAAWGVLFAIVHAYWAAGGELGMNGEPADTAGAQAYIGFVAVLGLAGAAVAAGLARAAAPRRRFLITLARAGGIALGLGVLVGTARWIGDGGLGGDGAGGVVITLYFLLGSVLFSALGRRSYDANLKRIRASSRLQATDV